MKKLILRFNARVGNSPLAKIEELTKKFELKIVKVEETKPGHKVVEIAGQSDRLHEMDRALHRYASISRKAA